jgi:hypothetical protein
MTLKQKAVLTGVAVSLISISGCRQAELREPGPGHHHGQEDKRVFRVYIYADPNNPGKCSVDWPVGTLWQGKHQTVLWVSDDGGEYTVDFTQGHHSPSPLSPFSSATTFTVSSSGVKPSGDLGPGASGYYDFAIRLGGANGTNCKETTDPGYYVKP